MSLSDDQIKTAEKSAFTYLQPIALQACDKIKKPLCKHMIKLKIFQSHGY